MTLSGNSASRVVRDLDEAAWRRFVDDHPLGNVFHTPELFEVFRRAAGHEPELWAAVTGGDVLALLTPVHVALSGGPLQAFTTRSVAYGGALCEQSARGGAALRLLLDRYSAATRSRSLFTELRNLSDTRDFADALTASEFEHEDHLNFLVDLERPTDEVFAGISRSTRKRLRRALRDGTVTVTEVTRRADLADWYDVLRKTYRRARVPVAPRSLFEAAFDVLVPAGMITFYAARVGDAVVACSAELRYRDTVYGWYGGSDRAYSELIPNEVLTWRVLERSAESGARVYDFGGAGKPDEEYGVRDFKAKFGGELVNFGRDTRVHAPLRYELGKVAYRVYQQRPARKAS